MTHLFLDKHFPAVWADLGPFTGLDATAWVELLGHGEHTAREGVDYVLSAVEKHNPALNAFHMVFSQEARDRAAELDALPANQRGPLHGIPVAVKEEYNIKGVPTMLGVPGAYTPAPQDSEVVRLVRDAGAIIIGTTRMPEFGLLPVTETKNYGVTTNPWDLTKTPGGSSGGSAAAVAAGIVPLALASDGCGSIRIPSARCGLYGLKPERGSVAQHEKTWVELGTQGPLARSARDLALVFDVIAEPGFTAALTEHKTLRIGVTTDYILPVARENKRAVHETVQRLSSLGHTIVNDDICLSDVTAAFLPQVIRGVGEEVESIDDTTSIDYRSRVLAAVNRIMPESVINRARQRSFEAAERIDSLFDDHGIDILLTPTVANRPTKAGAFQGAGPLRTIAMCARPTAFTSVFNVSGNPALAVPTGMGSDGLPLSVQLVAKHGQQKQLVGLAQQLN
ncbi:amidase family protein [Corynebacterium renale]|uniref:amidase n=1 Tax=Corynebacterium renale TaxID=1724 RepID=A0A2A9DR19_9CORY|nr:amidase family protein [Corynebacterium renale]PFG29034.1 amidase [Corynebacterium renale]SQI25298.1 amidase [Corynebacterium renale]